MHPSSGTAISQTEHRSNNHRLVPLCLIPLSIVRPEIINQKCFRNCLCALEKASLLANAFLNVHLADLPGTIPPIHLVIKHNRNGRYFREGSAFTCVHTCVCTSLSLNAGLPPRTMSRCVFSSQGPAWMLTGGSSGKKRLLNLK